jgi:hypothetical protein
MQKTLKFGGLIVAAVLLAGIIAALNFTPTYTVAQNETSTIVGNVTAGGTTSSSCGSGSTASSCYDAGYQSALANPGKTCPIVTATIIVLDGHMPVRNDKPFSTNRRTSASLMHKLLLISWLNDMGLKTRKYIYNTSTL